MKRIVILSFICFFVGNSFADEIISEKEFAQRYVNAISSKIEGVKAEIKGHLEVEVTYSDGEESTTYLDNAYKNYRSSPYELDVVIESYSKALMQSNSDVKVKMEKSHIFPVIKDIEYIAQITALMKRNESDGEFPFYYEKLNEVLYILYAIDTPSSIKYMPKEDIAKLGVKEEELKSLSMANLKKAIPSVQIEGDPSTISMIVADGTYEASFLLYDDLWTKDNFPVNGDIVVYVPSRDVVLVTGSNDVEGLKKVRSIVYNPENQWSHIVSEVGFVRKGDKWIEFNM
ncbi:DUF1444 family protein [uncultured Thalassolituus sp.]|uniref:DUF1444 family protein n=1 Tax=uncultured Thalassolituus sp. TaxID=285273 RepID=UPI002615D651|nr:DUF1444 family protein [uncultured Thalassolituus sp.]